ncbi:MAG: tetratricopeptide repeat protein [Methanobacteriota archaeon]|nr:MAG: tetratricopeptide repeat protein [Euryarchaeota archaeon]
MRDSRPLPGGDDVSLPSLAEVEHSDWPSLQRMCETLGLNPRGRSAVVRMRVADYVRHRAHPPSWRPAREHQAALLTRLGHPDLAERVWESTIQLEAPAPWVGLGHAQLAGGFLAEAAKSFGRAAQMGDPSGELHRAETLAAGGDYQGAVGACEAYLTTHARDLRGLLMKSTFLARSGFEEEAIKVLHTAAELHPEVPLLKRTLGIALLRSGHHAAAADALQEAALREPKGIDAQVDRGAALLLAGRTREAIGVLRETLETDPTRADALNNLGVAYLAMGRPKSAAVNLERAAKHRESPRILLNLGKVMEDAHEPAEAVRAYDQVLKLRAKDPEAVAGRKRLGVPSKSRRSPRKGTAKSPKKATRTVRRKTVPSTEAPPS